MSDCSYAYIGCSKVAFQKYSSKQNPQEGLLTRDTSTRPRNKSDPFSGVWRAISHFTLWRICLQVRSTHFRCVTFIVCVNCIKIPPGELFDDWLVNTLSTKQKGTSLFTCNSCGRKGTNPWWTDWNSRPGFDILFIRTKIAGSKFSQRETIATRGVRMEVWSQVFGNIYNRQFGARIVYHALSSRQDLLFTSPHSWHFYVNERITQCFCRISVIIHSAI